MHTPRCIPFARVERMTRCMLSFFSPLAQHTLRAHTGPPTLLLLLSAFPAGALLPLRSGDVVNLQWQGEAYP